MCTMVYFIKGYIVKSTSVNLTSFLSTTLKKVEQPYELAILLLHLLISSFDASLFFYTETSHCFIALDNSV